MGGQKSTGSSPAIAYLVRGVGMDWRQSAERFVRSYAACPAGIEHVTYVIYKGFESKTEKDEARRILAPIAHHELTTDDDTFDIGAYAAASMKITESDICFLNSHSELLGPEWLLKLSVNLSIPGMGLVGATGSFESPHHPGPNPHIRTTAFMIRRKDFVEAVDGVEIRSKEDAYRVENGPASLTRRIRDSGRAVCIVGRNGRGYAPRWWPCSDIFRQGCQANLLVGDNHTRGYARATFEEKRSLVELTWGRYAQGRSLLRLSEPF